MKIPPIVRWFLFLAIGYAVGARAPGWIWLVFLGLVSGFIAGAVWNHVLMQREHIRELKKIQNQADLTVLTRRKQIKEVGELRKVVLEVGMMLRNLAQRSKKGSRLN